MVGGSVFKYWVGEVGIEFPSDVSKGFVLMGVALHALVQVAHLVADDL